MDKKLYYTGIGLSIIVGIWVGIALYKRNDRIMPDDDEQKEN